MLEPIFSNDRWMIRVVIDQNHYFYVDGPYDGIDDGLLENFFNWDSYNPIYLFGDYVGLPKSLANRFVIKQSSHKNDHSFAAFYHIADQLIPTKNIKDCTLISFQGSITSHPIRKNILDALKKFHNFHFYPTKLWNLEENKGELRQQYLHSMNDSQFVMCPRGVGLNSIRFFETLRMGRIPILLADDTKLPLSWLINYENFVVFVPENAILNTYQYVCRWLEKHNIEVASQEARTISLEYFSDLNRFTQLCEIKNGN
jgi:hypothetical protein